MTKSSYPGPNRRSGPKDRRKADDDRRNDERLAEELVPRRNPEKPDRRK